MSTPWLLLGWYGVGLVGCLSCRAAFWWAWKANNLTLDPLTWGMLILITIAAAGGVFPVIASLVWWICAVCEHVVARWPESHPFAFLKRRVFR